MTKPDDFTLRGYFSFLLLKEPSNSGGFLFLVASYYAAASGAPCEDSTRDVLRP